MKRRRRTETKRRLYEVAESQLGYFTSRQALSAGYSHRLQSYHAGRGDWERIDHGIYRLRDFPTQKHEELVRWSLWARGLAVVSHATAAAWYDLGDLLPSRVHMTVPPQFRKRIVRAVIAHRGEVPEDDSQLATGFRITTPTRTILDLMRESIEANWLSGVVRDAVTRGLAMREELGERAATLDKPQRLLLRRLLITRAR